jgi:ABC-type Fe3+-citrate transport system substrate-binding protein
MYASLSYRSTATNNHQVLDTPEPLRNLADLIAAQLEYHKKAYEILSELAPVVDGLQVEQEVRRSEAFSA